MEKCFFALTLILFSLTIYAQVPQAFNYQGVARNLSGNPLPQQEIGLRISILSGSPQGQVGYSETHAVATNNLGLFNIQIGSGNPEIGSISEISWGTGVHFLQIEMDVNGGNDYSLMGTSQLLSVPYALYAQNGSKWETSDLNGDGIFRGAPVVIGEDLETDKPLYVNNNSESIGIATNNAIAQFRRSHNNSGASFLIFGYPDSDFVADHLRKSVMLYATDDAEDMVLCATKPNGQIRFFTQTWLQPDSERMRIDNLGNIGIGTTAPAAKLQVADGDIYIENIGNGVIMKSPNGQCWRMTIGNDGNTIVNPISCP